MRTHDDLPPPPGSPRRHPGPPGRRGLFGLPGRAPRVASGLVRPPPVGPQQGASGRPGTSRRRPRAPAVPRPTQRDLEHMGAGGGLRRPCAGQARRGHRVRARVGGPLARSGRSHRGRGDQRRGRGPQARPVRRRGVGLLVPPRRFPPEPAEGWLQGFLSDPTAPTLSELLDGDTGWEPRIAQRTPPSADPRAESSAPRGASAPAETKGVGPLAALIAVAIVVLVRWLFF
jgi:hypothetical protein